MLQIGSVIDGKYKILNEVGRGGMSIVYMAINERANKTWAIKEVRRDGVQDYEVVKQGLIVETDLLKRLDHPNLPSIIDVIEDQDTFLIVMDYIEGKSLDKVLREHGPQDQELVVKWARQICDVLGYLHSRKPPIIYRDMKPSNVMLKPDGNIVVFDFGIAREFKEGRVADTTCLGTRGYAAPEQYGGRGQTDPRTDIYCLGATMYHLLTGHNPSEPPYEIYPIRHWNPALSSGLEEIILRCTQQNPSDRFQSCAELMYALDHYSELDYDYRKRQNRRWVSFLATMGLTAACAAGAAGFYTAETTLKASSYDQYMLNAVSAADTEERFASYMNAIELEPEDEEAYLGILQNCFLEDGEFVGDEQKQFMEMLGTGPQGGRTHEDSLRSNAEGYARFSYEAAMAYFYYNTEGSKNSAIKWLSIAQEAESLTEQQRERASLLFQIASYYNDLGAMNLAGDSQVSYADYWRDMVEVTAGNLVERDNAMTALVMYGEMLNLISTNSTELRDEGISREELLDEIAYIRERLENDIVIEDSNRAQLSGKFEEVMEAAETAQKRVETVYAVIGGGEA